MDIGEQLSGKGRTRHLRETQLLDRLARSADQKLLPAADETRVEGVFGEGQIDDRFRGLDDCAPLPALEKLVVEHGEFASVDLQGIPVLGEGEHQPLGTGAFHVLRLDTGREGAKGQGLPTGFPPDRRARQLDLGDRPLLLLLAPQREGHGTTAENLILPLSR